MYTAIVLAQDEQPKPNETDPKGPGNGGGDMTGMLMMIGMIIFVVYFMMLRPQRKQQKQRQAMLSEMKKNDHVITYGGIHGVIYTVGDTEVVLKVDERNDVRLTVAKSAIGRIMTEEDQQAAETPA